MNDFTKEELEDIYDAVMDTELPMLGYLPTKIQYMIDNYCEHEWAIKFGSNGIKIQCPQCKKELI